ncbi:MAG TPA: endopeptidase La [Bryobacteraceae bacterium]|nr:endopeptidase La [Bryobacteraceae bacterium]
MLTSKEKSDNKRLPMMPIRDVVIFPYMMTPFVVGRESSVRALEEALAADKKIFLATQHDASVDEPRPDEIYSVGTVANIVQSLKLPDGNIKVLVEGVERGKVISVSEDEGYFRALVKTFHFKVDAGAQLEALVGRVTGLFEQYVKLSQNLNYETMIAAIRVDEPGKLADTVGANLQLTIEEKQELLEIFDPVDRLTRVAEMLDIEIEKLNVDRTIQGRVKRQMEKAQKEYYLNEKIKAIQKELGRGEKSEFDELKRKIETAGMTKDAFEKAMSELKRLENMPPMSAESTVSRNYLDWLLAVPWKKKTKEIRDLKYAQQVLESDHYGLEKIKERILEFLAVRRLVQNPKGSILCFVGPPGVGKTSLGMSIAKATGRKFVRLSLGGVRDEAEIRGHRRTYIGALPGQVLQMMKKAGTRNPVFMLDEIDKMSMDFRGDPSAALLEVLDPEQNYMFMDHYLDVEYDLSQVFFIATANVLHTVPPALQDRMEVIRLSGYTEQEKLEIAKRFLVPKQTRQTGIKDTDLKFTDDGIQTLIQAYTREAGVRNLEREIGNVCRKVARTVVNAQGEKNGNSEKNGKEKPAEQDKEKKPTPSVLSSETANEFLGPHKFRDTQAEQKNEVGATVGLAWTEVGGSILTTEAAVMEGKGKLQTTGKLGDVMQESAHAAMSYVRSRAQLLGLTRDFYRNLDIHVHVPEGAIPKDGPSAGITIATSICSALTNIPVRCNIAMTGEITVRGRVLPIGGLKEKLLAAHRQGIYEVILPKDNEKDLPDIPENIRKEMKLHFVTSMDEVLKLALEREIVALPLAANTPPVELVRETREERISQ